MYQNPTECFPSYGTKDWASEVATNIEKALAVEFISLSKDSPGPVQHVEEELARQIFSPIHIDSETLLPNVAAFDDVKSRGLSTNRLAHVSVDGVHQLGLAKAADDRASGNSREYVGFIKASVVAIRSLMDVKSNRLYCVYDTASSVLRHHADVCYIGKGATKVERKEHRRALQEIFSLLTQN